MIFSSQEKQRSRYETIIRPYRDNFSYSLPSSKQYWTLCANCSNDRNLIKESEFAQIVDNQLIAPVQFHGVDSDSRVIESNRKLKMGNFHHGDIYSVMANSPKLNPGVINLDLLRTFQTEIPLVRKMFLLLSGFNQFLLNINVLWESHHVKQRNPEEILEFLGKDADVSHCIMNYKWEMNFTVYPYKGIGPKTKMVSLIFIKK